jgi:lipopolysaccharide heptosyltransferase I
MPSPRILITRLSHIGDCILTLPMLAAVRRRYPDAFIAWAVESPSHQLLSLVPDLDEIITVPKNWLQKPSAWARLRRACCQLRLDTAIDPQGITKSAALGWLSGARTRVGIRGQWGRELSPWLNNRLVTTTRDHLADRSLELLQAMDIHNPTVEFRLPVDPASNEEMKKFIADADVGNKFVLLNPGASWPSKRWENDRFAEVSSYVWSAYGLTSVVTWAGQEELAMATSIKSAAKQAVVLAPNTNLRQLAALCSQALFFVGCDTGPMHLAAAVNTPCLGLYGPTRPGDSGAYGESHVHLQARYQAGTSRQRRTARNDAMREISVSDVCQGVDRLLAQIQSKRDTSRVA